MSDPEIVMFEEEFDQINRVLEQLINQAKAKVVFLVDKIGQLIAATGETGDVETSGLTSLTTENIQPSGGMAKVLGAKKKEFTILFHEGERDNLYITIVGGQWILVVIFDKHLNLELIRSQVQGVSSQLAEIPIRLQKKSGNKDPGSGEGGGSGGNPAESLLSIFRTVPSKESIH